MPLSGWSMDSKHTPLIQRHFDGQLSETETAEFARLLEHDSAFKKEVELFKKSQVFVELYAQLELKNHILQLDKNRKPARNISFFRIAASLVLIGSFALVFYSQSYSNQKLFASNYELPPDYITNLDAELTPLEKAMEFYNATDYAKAQHAFKAAASNSQFTEQANFFRAQCFIKTENPEQAIALFLTINGAYKVESQWHTALAFLQLDNTDQCIQTLKKIISENQDPAFTNKAKALIKKLDSPFRRLVLN
jgi:tetratricopeptide (TPR) repeat protein